MVLDIKNGLDIQYLSQDGFCILPWYTRPSLDVLESIDLSTKVIFEYGLGLSTIYYANAAKKVEGVETSSSWFRNVQDTLLHYGLLHKTFLKLFSKEPIDQQYYVHTLEPERGHDVIVIDGIERDACALHAIRTAKAGAIIILDNWLQEAVHVASKEVQDAVNEHNPVLYYSQHERHKDWCTAILTIT